jgi:hypothetical protein
VDTGEPVEIDKAYFGSSNRAYSTYISAGHSELNIESNTVSYDYLIDGINRFWIYPKQGSNHLRSLIDVVLSKDEKAPAVVEVKIATGVKVTGRVLDKVSKQPIADAAVKYEPENQSEL